MIEQELDFVSDGEAVVDDVAEVVGFLEAFEDVLEGADEIEDGNFRKGGGFFGRFVTGIGLVGETTLLVELAEGEESGGVLEFLYSMSWRMSSQRGSSSSTSSSGGCSVRGRRVLDFRYIRLAAMTMNSEARSMFRSLKVLM